MTSDLELPAAAGGPARVGQGTAIEQSRAVAEVQASIVLAAQRPRNNQAALRTMRESCAMIRLAERAFYRYKRGGEQITGPTVQLARELARIWGNISYGVSELARDDGHAQSEMQAWAWDLETNVRPAQIFIVPHKRDTKLGVKAIVDMRDIYEHNTNQAARRLRQQIWAILPPWFVDEAVDLCTETLRTGGKGAEPLAKRIDKAVELFRLGPKLRVEQLERRVGRPASQWDGHDLAQLTVIYRSLERGEIRIEDEFGDVPVTVSEIAAQAAPPAVATAASGHPAGAAVDVEDPPAGDDDLPDPPEDWAPKGDGGAAT